MKDYYYILGIKKDSTLEDVKKAYRKLSLKFHPDKNEGDEFFTERFKEIQEAYKTLSNELLRTTYNNKYSVYNKERGTNNDNDLNPIIEYFRVNKTSFEYDEEITFSWKTINTDKVIIKPFGTVPKTGQKIFRIKDFKNPRITAELIAENLNTGRKVRNSIVLNNNTFEDLYSHFKTVFLTENDLYKTHYKKYSSKKQESNNYSNLKYTEGVVKSKYDLFLGSYLEMLITFSSGISGKIMFGKSTGKYFYLHSFEGRTYAKDKEDCINQLYLHITRKR